MIVILNNSLIFLSLSQDFWACNTAKDAWHYNVLSLTSANVINTGSNDKLLGEVLHWSLCLTEPCTNLDNTKYNTTQSTQDDNNLSVTKQRL